MSFIINNQEIFQTNSSTRHINTRNKHHLHRTNVNLTRFPTSTFYAGIKIFRNFPPSVKVHKNDKAQFQAASTNHPHTHPFYSVDEIFYL